jgi:MFS transporter, UMF1 family
MLLVAVTAPILGAHADRTATKRPFLIAATVLMVVCTALLATVGPGMVVLGMLLFILANVGFQGGQVFYNAFLPEVSTEQTLGRVSGFSFALGYAGALISLAAALPYYRHTGGAGDPTPGRGLFLLVALGTALVALPTLLILRDARRPTADSGAGSGALPWRETADRLRRTLSDLRRHRNTFRFLLAYLVYMDAISTMIAFTAIYARTTIGLSLSTIVALFLVSQLTAIPGALLFGRLADRIGAKPTISGILSLWILILILALLARGLSTFLVVGLLAGVGTGSLQAVSRSMMSQLSPHDRQAEFFGFYAVAGRVSAVIGPVLFGGLSTLTGNQRIAIGALAVMIGVALLLLQRVGRPGPRARGPVEAKA